MNTRLLFLLMFLGMEAEAQSVWNKTYIEGKPTMLFSSIISDDTSFKVIGVASGTPNNQARGILGNIGLDGAMNELHVLVDSSALSYGLFWNTLIRNQNGGFAFAGYAYDSLPGLLLCISNNNLDSISVFRYTTPNAFTLQGWCLLQANDGYYYISGPYNSTPYNTDVFLCKIDSAGNRVWEKYYPQLKQDYANSITTLTNGNLMLGCVRNDLNQTTQHANTWLLEVDTGGNFVRQWFDPSDSTYAAEGLKQTQDGGFIYGARKKNFELGGQVSTNATVVKMDNTFTKQWIFIRGGSDLSIYTGVTDIEELPDSTYIVAGNLAYYGADTALNGWIVKLDVSGDVIWERTYRGINASQSLNFLSDVDVLPDGSFIAVGQCQLSGAIPPQIGWFLKLDSNGCEIENCLVGIEEPQAQQQEPIPLKLYPNPATTEITIAADETMLGSTLTITDITGRQMLSVPLSIPNSTFSIQHFSPGLYQVFVKRGEQVIAVGKFVKE